MPTAILKFDRLLSRPFESLDKKTYLKFLYQLLLRQLVLGRYRNAVTGEQLAAGRVHGIAYENASEAGRHVILEQTESLRRFDPSNTIGPRLRNCAPIDATFESAPNERKHVCIRDLGSLT